jgi:hypothetical protein
MSFALSVAYLRITHLERTLPRQAMIASLGYGHSTAGRLENYMATTASSTPLPVCLQENWSVLGRIERSGYGVETIVFKPSLILQFLYGVSQRHQMGTLSVALVIG